MSRMPHFVDNRHTDGGKSVGRPLPSRKIHGTHFSERLSRPQSHSVLRTEITYNDKAWKPVRHVIAVYHFSHIFWEMFTGISEEYRPTSTDYVDVVKG
jgi:hypothetical protein